jgi:membrane protein YdbS with pleckstrin-like domain
MYEPLRQRVLALLKVPPQPHPPMGDPASLRVFHAGKNYLRLRLAAWGFTQVIALAAIVFWTTMLLEIESKARAEKNPVQVQPSAPAPLPTVSSSSPLSATPPQAKPAHQKNWGAEFSEKLNASFSKSARERRGILSWWGGFKEVLMLIARAVPSWAFPLVWALKLLGFLVYLIQLPVTYAVRRLDYEMRWYMVTDRSLRIRYGVWKVSESTMSFANIQQVAVAQGPLQRLLGMADVKVQSAGGGGGEKHGNQDDDMHRGVFHSVTNAPEIRDLILERLRQFRASGLGDHDDHQDAPAAVATPSTATPSDALAAAQELLSEARALRSALS